MKRITVVFALFLMCTITASAQKTLKGAYADAFKMGCAVNSSIVNGRDSRSAQIILQQFNAVSPENDMKAEVLHPSPGSRPHSCMAQPDPRFLFQPCRRHSQEPR